MNICRFEINGEIVKIIRFLTDNVKFAKADYSGIQFTNELVFGNIVKELDEDAMKEIYGVPVSRYCNYMEVEVYKGGDEYYDDETDSYYAANEDDDRPYDLYKFRIFTNDGRYFSMTKDFFRGEYFRNKTFVSNKRELINEFFKDFSDLSLYNRKDKVRLGDWCSLKFEVCVYDFPIEVVERWREEYGISISMLYFDGKTVTRCYRHEKIGKDEEIRKSEYSEEIDAYTYLATLLENRWVDLYSIEHNLCDMLYDMKPLVPFKIDLELVDEEQKKIMVRRFDDYDTVYKMSNYYSNIRNTVYSLANSENKMQLVKLYMGVKSAHEDLFKGEKQYELRPMKFVSHEELF